MIIDLKRLERLLKAAGLKNTEVDADNAVSNNAAMLSRFNEGEIIEIPEDFVCYPSKNKSFKGAAAGVTKDGHFFGHRCWLSSSVRSKVLSLRVECSNKPHNFRRIWD